MSLFQVLLLWTCSWIGGAISSRWLGHAAEHYGNRPVLILCVALKSLLMASLLVCPRSPTLALCLLAPVFMFDMALNTGIVIANNGYLLKHSPVANRTMFIAAGTAVAGLVGGVTSIACGAWLRYLGDWSLPFVVRPVNGFHILFAVSIALRFVAMLLVTRIQEPQVKPTMQMVNGLLRARRWPVFSYSVSLYRRYWRRVEIRASSESEPTAAGNMDSEVRRRELARSA